MKRRRSSPHATLGVGIDIVEIGRIEALVRRDENAAKELLTGAEIADCRHRHRPARHIAARFAAKEAIRKALGIRRGDGVGWREIEIVILPSGLPCARLSGGAARAATRAGVIELAVSFAHTSTLAVAYAVAIGDVEPRPLARQPAVTVRVV